MEKLKADQATQRKKRLKLAILEEEKTIKKLEKKLNFNSKKNKSGLPKAFVEDGLDYLLNFCNEVNGKKIDGNFEEDMDEVTEDMDDNTDEDGHDGTEGEKVVSF